MTTKEEAVSWKGIVFCKCGHAELVRRCKNLKHAQPFACGECRTQAIHMSALRAFMLCRHAHTKPTEDCLCGGFDWLRLGFVDSLVPKNAERSALRLLRDA